MMGNCVEELTELLFDLGVFKLLKVSVNSSVFDVVEFVDQSTESPLPSAAEAAGVLHSLSKRECMLCCHV